MNGSAFYYVYGGYQVANVNIRPTPVAAFTALSAPACAYGGELEILLKPSSDDRLGFNPSYTNSYFVDKSKQAVTGTTRTFDYYFFNKKSRTSCRYRRSSITTMTLILRADRA